MIQKILTYISIHALRGEGDQGRRLQSRKNGHFNPRPPWGGRHLSATSTTFTTGHFNPRPPWGGRHGHSMSVASISRFQSTPSVGRATFIKDFNGKRNDISIHALRGEGDASLLPLLRCLIISIHALRGEGDPINLKSSRMNVKFQSTPSVGRATGCLSSQHQPFFISIHALRGEGDTWHIILC